MQPFLLGINYWPRSSAMAMWRRFDRAEIAEDFARIAGLGLNAVRFFLSWDAFAPDPATIDRTMLARLRAVVDAAHDARITTMPTLFTGHMSGVNWLPSWSLDEHSRATRFRTITELGESALGVGDIYADTGLLAAQRLFAKRAGETLRDHPAVLSWDLGNEFSNLRIPKSVADAASWSAQLSEVLQRESGRPVTAGTHGEDLTFDRNIRLSNLCEPYAYATMHGYSAYSSFARDRLDTNVVPFLCDVARAFSGKPVLFSEFGNPACRSGAGSEEKTAAIPCLDEGEMAEYATGVLDRLHARGALGAFWWCWADYSDGLATEPPFDRAPHEFRFGITRSDGSEKPIAAALAAFAREKRECTADSAAMPLNEERFYAGLPDSLSDAYARYCRDHA